MLDRLYCLIADDWRVIQEVKLALVETRGRLRARVSQALELGASGRRIARETAIPEANVRRWAKATPDTTSGPESGPLTAGICAACSADDTRVPTDTEPHPDSCPVCHTRFRAGQPLDSTEI